MTAFLVWPIWHEPDQGTLPGAGTAPGEVPEAMVPVAPPMEPVAGRHTAEEAGLQDPDDAATLVSSDDPLSTGALQRLVEFGKERGYGRQVIALKADGTVDFDARAPDPHGVAGLDDSVLRLRADAGDPDAQFVLAQRLLAQGVWDRQTEALREAGRLLKESAARGSTASLNALAQMEQNLATARVAERANHAVEALAHLMASERRGDLEASANRKLLAQQHSLDTPATAWAARRAQEIYADLAQARHALGLPPFDDAVPDDVRRAHAAYTAVVDRMMEPTMRRFEESARRERERLERLRAEAAERGQPFP